MAQLILAVILTVTLVAFSMANTHQVELSCVFGAPLQVRLIVLLAVAYGTGVVTAWFQQMARNAARQARKRREQALLRRLEQQKAAQA